MDELLLQRLKAIAAHMNEQTSVALSLSGNVDRDSLEKSEIVVKKLETSINRLNTELNNYFRLCNDPSADDISTLTTIQLQAEEALSELSVKVKRFKEERSNADTKVTTIRGNLPKLSLPQFEGDLLEWHQFWDQFESNVGSRDLSDVDKLLYLKTSLRGEAKKAIEGLETTQRNYQIAVTTLKNRYGKETHIIDAHYAALYKVKPASGKSLRDVRHTLNEIERHLRVLNSMGEDVNHNHLRFLIMEKFPEDIVYEMRLKANINSIEDMRRHLEIIITAREDASRITKEDNLKEEYTTQTLHITADNRRENPRREMRNFKLRTRSALEERRFNNINREVRRPNPVNKNITKGVYQNRGFKRSGNYQEESREIPRKKFKGPQCIFCEGSHFNDQCNSYKTVIERKERIKGKCYKCLRTGHHAKTCKERVLCVHCKKVNAHNRALCDKNRTELHTKPEPTRTYLGQEHQGSTVLQTAVVKASGEDEGTIKVGCRVLMDSGSQRTYITRDLVRKLKLPVEEESILSVFTFGSKKPQTIVSAIVKVQIETKTKDKFELYANVIPYISNIPYRGITREGLNPRIILADDDSMNPNIDILIGNDYYFTLISTEKIKLEENLFLVNSRLGWILTGRTEGEKMDDLTVITYSQTVENKLTHPDLPIDGGNVKGLWELESIGIRDSPEATREDEALTQFRESIQLSNNRYTVSWPWIEYPPNLPTNFGLAFGRLVNLLKRLDGNLMASYDATLKEQIEKGMIEILPESGREIREREHPVHYLPHHGVNQPGKPVRIVYDASAKTKGNKSLNECLHCGPLMLEDLTGMFLRFRAHVIGITADVEKAFLQIGLNERDRDVTRFLWLRDISKPANKDNLLHLRFCRVPFGVISSPFLLNATLKHHLLQQEDSMMERIVQDIYVDNLVTGTNSIQEAKALYSKCKRTFQDISMNLREWHSNSEVFLKDIPKSDITKDTQVKVLGINWCTERDNISLKPTKLTEAETKREVLKNIASIYNPCGYAVPELLESKIFIQELWEAKFDWDEKLPVNLKNKWQEITTHLKHIDNISLPRTYFRDMNKTDLQLHCFTDSSTKAYAAVVYITNGKEISFVIGKSRLVPVKDKQNLQIPRLELLGALIGSRLVKYVTKFLPFSFTKTVIWTDSQIVIDWCRSQKTLPPFISKRVQEIKNNTASEIRYVPTNLNPADVSTRPSHSKEERDKWRQGEKFILNDPKTWPSSTRATLSVSRGEGLTKDTTQESSMEQEEIREHNERDQTNFQSNNKGKNQKELSEEIKRIQREFFRDEVEGKETNLKRNLGLFIDERGLLRCKGRLKYTYWSYDKKYPILLPKDCDFTNKIIKETHEKNYHVGANHTLSQIRKTYWIPQGRSRVQKVLKTCKSCVKHGGGAYKLPPIPALPVERVNYSPPFTFTGMDYLGPLQTKTNKEIEKCWVCLYTCLAVRAIHLEVVKNLTTEECLLALRRFISSKGIPTVIISDNAAQFKLTSEVLTSNYCISNSIRWKFIPQLAPWHGGFYERLVGLVKHCLKRTLAKHLLTDNQFVTAVKEIEAVINSRPLTNVGAEVEDVLRPSDFLTLGRCLVTQTSDQLMKNEGTTTKQDLVEGWKRGQKLLEEFKEMFVDQYLPSLRQRYQQHCKEPRVRNTTTPKIGQLVQIKNDNKNRHSWKVGKISSLLKGKDGECRVARVRVGDKEFTRSINHLYPLEMEETDIDDKGNTEINKETHSIPDHNRGPLTSERISSPERDTASKVHDYEPEGNKSRTDSNQETTELVKNRIVDETDPEDITESTEEADLEEAPLEKILRNASIKAREKIREWTSDLMNLL